MKNQKENTIVHKDYTQVCVWPGTIVEDDQHQEMVEWFKDEFDTGIQFLETIFTKPDRGDKNSGGRADVFFAIHKDDIGKMILPIRQIGARWIEDVLSKENYKDPIYPRRVFDYNK